MLEAPRAPHLLLKNASANQPAKLLVWILDDEGAQVLRPLFGPKNYGE